MGSKLPTIWTQTAVVVVVVASHDDARLLLPHQSLWVTADWDQTVDKPLQFDLPALFQRKNRVSLDFQILNL